MPFGLKRAWKRPGRLRNKLVDVNNFELVANQGQWNPAYLIAQGNVTPMGQYRIQVLIVSAQ